MNNERGREGAPGRGFAAMTAERRREIARKGGQMSGGNFKNNREKASQAGRKGGERSGSSRARQFSISKRH
jgi:general stress protein YciG